MDAEKILTLSPITKRDVIANLFGLIEDAVTALTTSESDSLNSKSDS